MDNTTVFDLGGSVVSPDIPDLKFLDEFQNILTDWLSDDLSRKAVIVVGGGSIARNWQNTARKLNPHVENDSLDWIGIQATRLNGEMVRAILGKLSPDPLVTDPTGPFAFEGRVLICAGWKPGFSTDFDSVILAERLKTNSIIMISNIPCLYSEDPLKNPQATPIETISWQNYSQMIHSKWDPGANMPFDPVASKQAQTSSISVKLIAGNDLQNLQSLLKGNAFQGTTIS